MRVSLLVSLTLFSSFAVGAVKLPPPKIEKPLTIAVNHQAIGQLEVSALDVNALIQKDSANARMGQPFRYGVVRPLARAIGLHADGLWNQAAGSRSEWHFEFHAKGAVSLEFEFSEFFLPHGAVLKIINPDTGFSTREFTDQDNKGKRHFHTPVVMGERARLVLTVPAGLRKFVKLKIATLTQAYRNVFQAHQPMLKSGSCNVDVVCPEGDPWRDQIASVASYTFTGFVCTGQLLADTKLDRRALFHTANHCVNTEAEAESMVVYWNYESPTCRTAGSVNNQTPISRTGVANQSGATLRAGYATSDVTIVELDADPVAGNAFWSGWDHGNQAPTRSFSIHHPAGHAKRLAFDNDPAVVVLDFDTGQDTADPNGTHLRVGNYEIGTTEGGSSGAGLWDAAGRVVGQLHGGAAACTAVMPGDPPPSSDNDQPDWYGRMATSWEGGGTADTRVRDWLDPVGTGTRFIDGQGPCAKPTVSIQLADNPVLAGDLVTFTATASGGAGGPFSFDWDVDGDGLSDASGPSVQVRYTHPGAQTVAVNGFDQTLCKARGTFGVAVAGADVRLQASNAAAEIEGDGDSVMEPGERWAVDITVKNLGTATLKNARGRVSTSLLKSGGYQLADSASAACGFSWVDISATGNAITFKPAGVTSGGSTVPGNDDGASDPIGLGFSGFKVFSDTVSGVAMSSNGYLSGNVTDDGGDFSSDCPLPKLPDSGSGARLMPFHDDLITGNAFEQGFTDCPRPGDATSDTGACHVFSWRNVGFFGVADVSFDLQAILYAGSSEVVYQYLPGDSNQGANASVGVQDALAKNAATYTCGGTQPVRANSAVCLFHPDAPAKGGGNVILETPAPWLGSLVAGASKTVTVAFAIKSDANCGDPVSLDLEDVVGDGVSIQQTQGAIFNGTIGAAGNCDRFSNIAPQAPQDVPAAGIWFNPLRSGNGIDIYSVSQGKQLVLTWYTALAGGKAIWYQSLADFADSRAEGALLKFTWDGSKAVSTVVGTIGFTVTDSDHGVLNWRIGSDSGAELYQRFVTDTSSTAVNHTGLWFDQGEPGWGMTFNDQGNTEVAVVYFYDTDGEPVWSLGFKDIADTPINMETFRVACPQCVWTDLQPSAAGTVSRGFNGVTTGTVSVDLNLAPPRIGSWQRNSNITLLTTPQP